MEKVADKGSDIKRVRRIHAVTIEDALVFCTGVFSTMPIVCLKIFGRYVSLFTIFFALTAAMLLLRLICVPSPRRTGGNIGMFLLWLVMSAVSSAIGWLYFKGYPAWRSATFGYLPKVAIYFVFAILWSKQRNCGTFARYLLRGMLVGCVLNLCWSIIDAAGFYAFGVSVNNVVFKQYAIDTGTRFGTVSLIINGMIRAPGFNDDPAHIGFLAPAVIAYGLYKKKDLLILLGLASIFSSASTTALVGAVFVILVNFRRVLDMLTLRRVIVLAASIVAAVMIIAFVPQLRAMVVTVKDKFFDRIVNTYGKIDSGGERSVYLFGFFTALKTAGVMILFGTGFGTASYAYVFDPTLLARLGEHYYFPYDMEMTYIAYFFDLGIFGFALFMIMLYRLFRGIRVRTSRDDALLRALILGMALSMLFYHFTLMAMQVLITIAGLTRLDVLKHEKRAALWQENAVPPTRRREVAYVK